LHGILLTLSVGRYTEIERENRILLEKMSNIMQSNKSGLWSQQQTKPSLNREQRKRELLRITLENQAILKRLQEKQPTHSVTAWERQYQDVVKYRENICEQPYVFDLQNSRQRYMLSTADIEANEGGYNSLPRIPGTSQGIRQGRLSAGGG
jgi:hypothetical protein